MPNMSRKTIHSVHGSEGYTDFAHKETNTESFTENTSAFTSSAEFSSSKLQTDINKYANVNHYGVSRKLFNNNYDSDYELYEKTTYSLSRWSRFKRTVISIFTSILTVFYYTYNIQTAWLAKLHKFTSRIMLLDTWLLWKRQRGNKSAKLVALCLIPLLLLGGWWILSSLGSIIYGAYYNSTIVNIPNDVENEALVATSDIKDFDKIAQININQPIQEKIVKITEKVYMEPPTANEIAAGLSSKQLEAISKSLKDSIDINEQFNTEDIVQKIIHNPSFQTVINNYNNLQVNKEATDANIDLLHSQQNIINSLRDEVNKMKRDILDIEKARSEDLTKIISEFKIESVQTSARLTHQLNRCCRRSIINIEGYVNRILGNLLNDGEFLKNQKGLTDYLHSMFLARQDLEAQLINLTRSLNSRFDGLVEANSRSIMDDVTRKITLEINEKIKNVKTDIHSSKYTGDITLNSLSDERIKEIVTNTLKIYDADRTGLVDYAMETMGGQILTTRCTENYHYGKAVVSVLGIPLWYPVNSPRTIITPSISPGECWAFQNFPGFVVIRLSNRLKIEAFSMEHISKLLVPNGKIDSAPKDFEVYGLSSENDNEPLLLGQYVYDYDGEAIQFFPVQNKDHIFEIVEIRILSNHGNPNYTCLYRFRVHGRLSQEPT